MAKDYFKGLKSESKKIEKAANKYADFAGEVAALPYKLKDEYRKAQDPILGQKINVAEQNVMGGAIQALDKYKDISDPTTRRALAEKYQGGLSIDYKNLTDERTRREGVYSDYITKWTGLYGAEAAKQQAKVSAMESSWSRSMNLAGQEQSQANRIEDNAESRRRWDYEQAHKGSVARSKEKFLSDVVESLENSLGEEDKRVDPSAYEKARNLAISKGISKSDFDKNFSYMLSTDFKGNKNAKKDYDYLIGTGEDSSADYTIQEDARGKMWRINKKTNVMEEVKKK